MADENEEKPSAIHDFASTKAAIFDTFNKLKKWREEQVQQFQNLQYLESQKLIRLSGESQKHFEKLLENASKTDAEDKPKSIINENSISSDLSLKNDVENHNTLHESSITGHLQRCFNDSSRSSLSLSENKASFTEDKIPGFIEAQKWQCPTKNVNEKGDHQVKNISKADLPVRTKRSFLKKGSGLLRYMPKSSNDVPRKSKGPYVSKTPMNQKRNIRLPQKTLVLKPTLKTHKTDGPSENVKHIRFDIPASIDEDHADNFPEDSVTPTSRFSENETTENDSEDKYSSLSSNSPYHSPDKAEKLENTSNSGCESSNLSKENKELEEFEMLENCVQNSSFNSDSSVVQRILHGGINKPAPTLHSNILKPPFSNDWNNAFNDQYKSSGSSIFSAKIGLSKCLEEAHARKEILQKVISDINPRIQSLQKEISRSQQEAYSEDDVSERCSTPIEDLNGGNAITTTLPENDSDVISDFLVSPPTVSSTRSDSNFNKECQSQFRSTNTDDILEDPYRDDSNLEEEDSASDHSEIDECHQISDEKSMIRKKLKELDKEIKIYQDLNSKLSSNCKERNEFLKKLQKERDDFNKYKEAEKKKIEAEIEEERRQIKRQKETFTRYQKLRKDNPTRKERDEMNSLRQEIEKLQEEVKRQKIRYTSDSRRWKNQLEAAERERDSFKLENIRLEEQCQDLLAALKSRIKRKPDSKSSDKVEESVIHENILKKFPVTKDVECQTKIRDINSDISQNPQQNSSTVMAVKKTKAKVRFNLHPEYQKNELETVVEDEESKTESLPDIANIQPEETATILDQDKDEKSRKKDIEANLSTISVSAESEFKEIDHGNKIERLYVSGDREIIFHSGTRKIITADGRIKFLFYNGDIKEIFPDKREIYRYVNGIIETHFPDGLEVTEFPNGQVQKRHPDGQKEVTFTDGTVHNMFADGSEKISSADGSVVTLSADGTKTTEFANGQKEIRTSTFRRREFPDGAVKIIYDSGRQETRYPNGRIRIKDKAGKVLFDTKYIELSKETNPQ